MPEVTVLIPNYNHAPYLNQRIDSVLNQTYQDFEVIILDDCSPDNSREVIEQYRNHPRVSQIVFNETNSGTTFKQWEKGIGLAQGKYIWLAESDDWCEPNLLEVLVSGMHNNPRCVLAYCQSHCIDNNLHIKWQSHHTQLSEYFEGADYVKKYLSKANRMYNASMAIFSKEAYFKLNKDFTQFKFCGDWIFWAEIASQGDVFISAKPLNFFRKHGKDVSGSAYASGLYFIEDYKVLQLLKSKSLIDDTMYQEMLVSRYKRYLLARFKFKPEVSAQIDALYFEGRGFGWKLMLRKEAFKQKMMRYNNNLVKKMLS
jgi:glycosyltransferase involved in cell wall biosynthesis